MQHGNAVATTTTLNDLYGSGVYIPSVGFFMNDEMDDFTSKPGVPNMYGLIQGEANAIAPGKRMLSAMSPTIVLDPKVTHTSRLARVHITTAATGVSAPGTVYRMDEIPLPLRPALKSPYPTDEEVIRRIYKAVAAKPAWMPGAPSEAEA